MRHLILGLAAVAAAALMSPSADAGEKAAKAAPQVKYDLSKGLTIVRWGESTRGGSSWIKSHKDGRPVLAMIKNDPELGAELRARAVQFKNLVGYQATLDGGLIVFIK